MMLFMIGKGKIVENKKKNIDHSSSPNFYSQKKYTDYMYTKYFFYITPWFIQ